MKYINMLHSALTCDKPETVKAAEAKQTAINDILFDIAEMETGNRAFDAARAVKFLALEGTTQFILSA
jgi:hypothetical protein